MENLKQFCPVEVIKTLGAEAIWLFNKAKELRELKIADLDQQEAYWLGEDDNQTQIQ